MDEVITIQFDGGSRGNPGPAGIGAVLRAADETPIVTIGKFIGRATNNVAEYRALIAGLHEALKLGAKHIIIRGDSELIVRQMNGQYRVKSPELRELYDEAHALLAKFKSAKIEHNLRHHNSLADKLANLAMDKRGDVNDADAAETETPAPAEEASEPPAVGDRLGCPNCGCIVEIRQRSSLRPHQLKPMTCFCGSKLSKIKNATLRSGRK